MKNVTLLNKTFFCGFLVLGLALDAAAIDLTEAVRNAGKASYDISGGSTYGTYTLGQMFDGKYVNENERAVLAPSVHGATVTVGYSIADDFASNSNVVVESFSYCYSRKKMDYGRTPRRVRLEASADGTTWVLLAENAQLFEILTGSADVSEEDADSCIHTVNVPVGRQRAYRNYRFVLSNYVDSSQGLVVAAEFFLNGRIERNAEAYPELTWNGGETGGVWDATTANWMTADGTATNWIPHARAVIDAKSITVVSTAEVGSVRFAGTNETALAGGTLDFCYPSRIEYAGAARTIGSAILARAVNGTDTVEKCVQGTKTSDFVCLPRATDVENPTTGREVIWWQNR